MGHDRQGKEVTLRGSPPANPACVEKGPEWTWRVGESSVVICQAFKELGQRLQHRPLQLTHEDLPLWRFSSF